MDDLAQLMTHQHPQVRAYGQVLAQQMQQEKAREDQQSFLSQEKSLDRQNRMDVVAGQLNQAMMMGLISKEQKDQMMEMQKQQMASTAEHQKGQLGLQQQIAAQTAAHNKNTEALQRMDAETKRLQVEQGKTPPGYRFLPNGELEAIKNGPADLKQQGMFNQDTSMLQNSNASFDRLGAVTNELLNHPGLNGITGVRGKVPDVPGTDAANARALLATLKSQIGFGVLQEMRNNSKTGGALGAVSDAEGKRLENNLAALDTTQGVDQFKKQLHEILSYTEGAKGRLRDTYNMKHKTGEPVPMSPSSGKGPSVGTVDGGYRFKGGDPSKPESWEKVN